MLGCVPSLLAQTSPITLSLTKSSDAPTPVPSGQQFTYTLVYNWSGGIPGTIIINDVIPPELQVVSTIPAATVSGNNVTFSISDAATTTMTGGAGTVQINVKFAPGVTCNGTRACNVATIKLPGNFTPVSSNQVCNTASAQNKWTMEKSLFAGCAVDNDVIFRVCIMNPAGGDIGGLNLTNVTMTDLLPANAVVTSIPGYTYTQTGSSVTINTGLPSTLPVSPWNAWYCLYIHVTFPSASFSTGQTVTNMATLRYNTPCDTARPLTMSDTGNVTLCAATNTGSLGKYLSIGLYFPSNPYYYPSFSPGCCGTYTMYYNNTGTTAQNGFVMEDLVPSTLDVSSVVTNVPSGQTVTVNVYCWTGTSCGTTPCATATYTVAGAQTLTIPASSNVCKVRWTYSAPIPVAASLSNNLNVCVRTASYASPFTPVAVGQNIVNTVTAQATGLATLTANHTKPVDSLRPKILASKFFMGGCDASTCSPLTAGPFVPGNTVRWRMAVSNVGNTNAAPCVIYDTLPAGLTFAGNVKYFYGTFNWLANQYAPPCCSLTTTVPTQVGGTITTPATGATNLAFSFPVLPYRCDGQVDYFVIEFDVLISSAPPAPPGLYTNKFTFTAGNLPAPSVSNPAYLTVNSIAQLTLQKEVRLKPSGTFSTNATIPAGQTIEYRLRVTNSGNLALKDICLLDIMPHGGDIYVLPPYNPRASAFDIPLLGGGVVAPAGYTTGYNNIGTTKNPRRSLVCSGFCGVADPVGAVTGAFPAAAPPITYSFTVSSASATTLAPGASLDVLVTATVPATATPNESACNNFGVRAVPANQPSACMTAQSNLACVRVAQAPSNECEKIWQKGGADSCCTYRLSIANSLGALSSLQYNVLGGSGVVQSIQSTPCLPTSTVPASLAGTTSGTLNYLPSCTAAGPLNLAIEAQSTTTNGRICIELIATINTSQGEKITCRDTICFQCKPAVKTRCDSMSVKPFPFNDLDLSGRTFKIWNMKVPASPICSVKIVVTPPPSGPGVNGGGLYIDGVWKPWPFGTSVGYTQILPVHGMPANTTVQFNLGIDYTIGWIGNVTVTAYHCDGDSCVNRYGPWKATKDVVIGGGTDVPVPDKAKLHVHRLEFPREKFTGKNVKYIAVRHSDPVEKIVAVTAANFDCDTSGDCDDRIEVVRVRDRVTLVELRKLLDRGQAGDIGLTFLYTASNNRQPTVEIIYYDDNGQEVGHDNVAITGSTLGVGDNEGITGVLGSLTAHPNPTTGRCELGFTLPASAMVDLEILDALGARVGEVIAGERLAAGKHTRTVDMSTLPSGTYLMSLRIDGVPTVMRVELVR
jgi:uncharacterized repeat protein (TIGR01451 family)